MMGVEDVAVETRIHSPVEFDLGSRQPEEIALAIIAEIIAERHAALPKSGVTYEELCSI